MIAVHCVHCGARNRIRGRSRARHPFCGKCDTPLPARVRWLRIPADLRSMAWPWIPPMVLTGLGLLLGTGLTGWWLYPSMAPLPPVHAQPASAMAHRAGHARRALPPPVQASAGVQQAFDAGRPRAPLELTTPDGPLRYYVRIEDADSGRLVMTVLLDGGHPLRTRLPFGSYRLDYAVGRTWYGPQALFGPGTRRFQLDRVFPFRHSGHRYLGARFSLGQASPIAADGAQHVPAIELEPERPPPMLPTQTTYPGLVASASRTRPDQ